MELLGNSRIANVPRIGKRQVLRLLLFWQISVDPTGRAQRDELGKFTCDMMWIPLEVGQHYQGHNRTNKLYRLYL